MAKKRNNAQTNKNKKNDGAFSCERQNILSSVVGLFLEQGQTTDDPLVPKQINSEHVADALLKPTIAVRLSQSYRSPNDAARQRSTRIGLAVYNIMLH